MNAPRVCARCGGNRHDGADCPKWGSGGREAFTEELLAAVEGALLPRRDDAKLRYEVMRARMSVLRGLFARYPDEAGLQASLAAYVQELKRERARCGS